MIATSLSSPLRQLSKQLSMSSSLVSCILIFLLSSSFVFLVLVRLDNGTAISPPLPVTDYSVDFSESFTQHSLKTYGSRQVRISNAILLDNLTLLVSGIVLDQLKDRSDHVMCRTHDDSNPCTLVTSHLALDQTPGLLYRAVLWKFRLLEPTSNVVLSFPTLSTRFSLILSDVSDRVSIQKTSVCIPTVRNADPVRLFQFFNYYLDNFNVDNFQIYVTKEELSSISSLLTSPDRYSLIVVDDDRVLNQVHYFGQSLILLDCLLNSVNRYEYLFLNDIDEYLMLPKYFKFSDLFDDETAAVSFGTKRYLIEFCTVQPSNFEIFNFSSPIDIMPIELSMVPACRKHKHQHLKFDPEFCVRGKGLRKYIVKPNLIEILFVHSPIVVTGKKIKEVSTRFGLYRHYRGYPYKTNQNVCSKSLEEFKNSKEFFYSWNVEPYELYKN
ncbi:hypothetical protein GEMRC1_010896 [Eukaryota sp. GEM-RC1]